MPIPDLTPGTLVEGLIAHGSAEVVSVKRHGSSMTVTFRDVSTGKVDEVVVFDTDGHKIKVVEAGRAWEFDGAGDLFRLAAEAHRIRLAYLFDPLLAVHTSSVEPLPHQIAAVYEEMLQRQPLRFLLADDPGAGKTIMAGLFIRELMLRGDLERCLVVCPANLAEQWQDELSDKFRLNFDIISREMIEASTTNNPFLERDLLIGRIDLMKTDDNMDRLRAAEWDLVVVDEAHKMSATFYGSEVKYTARYKLGELLGGTARPSRVWWATRFHKWQTSFWPNRWMRPNRCGFGHRSSVFMDDHGVVVRGDVAAKVSGTDEGSDTGDGGESGSGADDGDDGGKVGGGVAVAAPRRFYGTIKLNPQRLSSAAGQVGEEVLQHLVGLVDSDVEVTLEVTVKVKDGIPERVVRVVSENAATLKFDHFEFEEE